MTPEEKQRFNDAINAYRMSPEKAYELSQNISKARKQAEGLPIFGTGIPANFLGGAASSFSRGLADTAGFFNFNNVENFLNSGADYIDERLPDPIPAELSWNYLTNPAGLARGSGNVAGSICSIALPAGGAGIFCGAG